MPIVTEETSPWPRVPTVIRATRIRSASPSHPPLRTQSSPPSGALEDGTAALPLPLQGSPGGGGDRPRPRASIRRTSSSHPGAQLLSRCNAMPYPGRVREPVSMAQGPVACSDRDLGLVGAVGRRGAWLEVVQAGRSSRSIERPDPPSARLPVVDGRRRGQACRLAGRGGLPGRVGRGAAAGSAAGPVPRWPAGATGTQPHRAGAGRRGRRPSSSTAPRRSDGWQRQDRRSPGWWSWSTIGSMHWPRTEVAPICRTHERLRAVSSRRSSRATHQTALPSSVPR